MGVEGFCVSMAAAAVLHALLNEPPRELWEWPMWKLMLVAVVVAPVVETVIFQQLPILFVRAVGGEWPLALAVSVTLFSVIHLVEGVMTGVSAGVIGGFYLAYLFSCWVERSTWTAYWTTALSHMTRNGLAMALVALSKAV